jgi:hypothetical protein
MRAVRTQHFTYLSIPIAYRRCSSASAAWHRVVEIAATTSSATEFASASESCVSVDNVRM